ncbi:glycosyltransferase family 2 protein [Candidatus Roizmanbacteria bacterium]|nr:glycosyltransferase family 2 protein [Candidatus Roizmanbacteria bacterium]
MQTITAVIPARNEENNITRCIESAKWCNKIIVMWMGNDKTGIIAKKMGAEVVKMNSSEKDNFIGVQKNINWVIDHCTTDWILRVDADEVVTDKLQKEILSLLTIHYSLQITNSPIAYGIPRVQYFWGGFLKGGDWAYDRLVRLFQPKYCRYHPIVPVHEQFTVKGTIGYLKNKLLHYSHPTLKDAVKKFQVYTDIEAAHLQIAKFQAFWNLIFQPPYVFLRWTIWHHGYRDGIRGIIAGAFRGWYEFLLYKKYLFKKSKN